MTRFKEGWNSMFHRGDCRKVFPKQTGNALEFHRQLSGYAPTPLHDLRHLAKALKIGRLLVKDESYRFGLNAFKVLGASYATFRFLKQAWEEKYSDVFTPQTFFETDVSATLGEFVFTAATDGNHGRAVAWTAKTLGQKSVIYIPSFSTPARIENLRKEGAEVVVVEGTYDDAVEQCTQDAAKYGRHIISDTAWPGYEVIPSWIVEGYQTLFEEAQTQYKALGIPKPDVVFLQTGVGGLSAAGTWFFVKTYGESGPKLVCVEPTSADCVLESVLIGDGLAHSTRGPQDSIMAGLNCGTPSLSAWPLMKTGMEYFLALEDEFSREAMRRLQAPLREDPAIISGESGAAGLAALLALCQESGLKESRERLGLHEDAVVLVLNTEGDTDPEHYKKIVSVPPRPL